MATPGLENRMETLEATMANMLEAQRIAHAQFMERDLALQNRQNRFQGDLETLSQRQNQFQIALEEIGRQQVILGEFIRNLSRQVSAQVQSIADLIRALRRPDQGGDI